MFLFFRQNINGKKSFLAVLLHITLKKLSEPRKNKTLIFSFLLSNNWRYHAIVSSSLYTAVFVADTKRSELNHNQQEMFEKVCKK